MRYVVSISALAFVVASAFAGQDAKHPHFIAVKGDHEFTGQMIVRPTQIGDLTNLGVPVLQAMRRHALAAALVAPSAIEYRPQVDEYIVKLPAGTSEDAYAARLMAQGDFQYVEPNWRVFLVADPNDPLYSQQWHLPKIQASQAWDLFTGNHSVIVALTDTGIRLDHEDLHNTLVPGYNAVSGLTQQAGGDVNDTNGHGTHTAGIAGAIGNNGLGVSGVSWNVGVMPIKVTVGSGGSSSIATLTGGALWAADHGARVVSTSFSGFDSSNSVQTTGDYIKHTRNGFYCWAAGNDGRNLTSGDWPDVTIVGATDSNDLKASFSAFGLAIDVMAPGVNIMSSYASASNGYTTLSGTSMATPCTAGIGAMVIMANPSLTGQQVEDLVYQGCNSLGNTTNYGWGRVNLYNTLRLVYNTTTFSPATMTVVKGQLLSGGTDQLGAMDSQFAAVKTVPVLTAAEFRGIKIQFDTYSTISTMGSMTFSFGGMVSTGNVSQTLELFDWVANNWVQVDQRLAPQSDTLISLNPTNPNRFKASSGLMRARVTYLQNTVAVPPFTASVDEVAFLTAAP